MKKCFEFPEKKRFNTLRDAETAILLIGNVGLRAYLCGCGGYHITKCSNRQEN
jgi:hypothetical protein